MSEFIMVGMTAMRDPKTGDLLSSVPLYVEVTDGGLPPLPELDRKQFAKDVRKKMKALKAAEKENPADGTDISGKPLP